MNAFVKNTRDAEVQNADANKGHLMNLTRSVVIVSLMLFFFTTGTSSAFEFSVGSRYFDYGNGAINLNRVTHINPKVSYYITLPQDSKEDLLKKYGSAATSESISKNILPWLEVKKLEKAPFYYVNISTRITFDNFNLTMLKGKDFLKVPSPKQLAEKGFLFKFPTFVPFLKKLSEYKNLDPNNIEFYDNLLKKLNELKKEDFKIIKTNLHNTVDTYKRAIK